MDQAAKDSEPMNEQALITRSRFLGVARCHAAPGALRGLGTRAHPEHLLSRWLSGWATHHPARIIVNRRPVPARWHETATAVEVHRHRPFVTPADGYRRSGRAPAAVSLRPALRRGRRPVRRGRHVGIAANHRRSSVVARVVGHAGPAPRARVQARVVPRHCADGVRVARRELFEDPRTSRRWPRTLKQ
jgi:hypothetical protein